MKSAGRPGLCWYCGHAVLLVSDPPEHVIPDSMGGRLKTLRVCESCNHDAGRLIDAPFMKDMLIFWDRLLHLPASAKLPPQFEATLEDGTPVDLRMTGKGPWTANVRSSIKRDGDQIRIRARDQAEYERLLERVRKDLAKEGRELPADLGAPQPQELGEVRIATQLDGVVWLRMAAKITLGVLSLVVDEQWIRTPEAAKLRGWLWDENPQNPEGSPALAFPHQPTAKLDTYVPRPPEHLLYLHPAPGESTVGLRIVFFGTLFVSVEIELGGYDCPLKAWRTTYGQPVTETDFQALVMEATLAVHELDPPSN
ncbi:MAG: hypothetical protein H0U51_10450 [Propionibacteriales bacterium]|nr:hypothetical protein [Propionibacteriales bacterium]